MKKIFCLVLCLFAFACCDNAGSGTAGAANWIKIVDGYGEESITYFFDPVSFKYHKSLNTAKCWTKARLNDKNKELVSYQYFKLADHSVANKVITLYENGNSLGSRTKDSLTYNKILPGTAMEKIFDMVEFCVAMENSNLHWTLNKDSMGKHSPMDSPAWKRDPATGAYYDVATQYKYSDNLITWMKFNSILYYCKIDYSTKKMTLLGMERLNKDGSSILLQYPVLIWFNAGSNPTPAEAQVMKEELALLLGA